MGDQAFCFPAANDAAAAENAALFGDHRALPFRVIVIVEIQDDPVMGTSSPCAFAVFENSAVKCQSSRLVCSTGSQALCSGLKRRGAIVGNAPAPRLFEILAVDLEEHFNGAAPRGRRRRGSVATVERSRISAKAARIAAERRRPTPGTSASLPSWQATSSASSVSMPSAS